MKWRGGEQSDQSHQNSVTSSSAVGWPNLKQSASLQVKDKCNNEDKTKTENCTHLFFQLTVAILPLSLSFPVPIPVPLAMAITLPTPLSVIIFMPVTTAGLVPPALFPRAAMVTFPGTFSPDGEI